MLKKDCSLTSLIKPSIYILIGVVFLNLIMSIGNLDHSLLVAWSGDVIQKTGDVSTDAINSWALRGQIGDIMSGHFSALAFLAVALGILLQIEANKQMRESIDKQDESIKQQSLALGVQSESLKEQIKELKESRKENSKQTEEFFIQNMNVKMDRYYKMLNESLNNGFKNEDVSRILNVISKRKQDLKEAEEQLIYATNLELVRRLFNILQFIFDEIITIKDTYPDTFRFLLNELSLRINNNTTIHSIAIVMMSKGKTEENEKNLFLGLIELEAFEKAREDLKNGKADH